MAKKTVSQLPAAESMGENDVLLMETPSATKCITKNALLQDVNTTLATKADAKHTHAIADVTDLQTKLDEKANTADLKTVATSGSYSDLTDRPTIPTSLPANGGNANTVGGISLAIKTSDEYTALEAKSDKTLYIISDGGKIYLGSTLIAEVNPSLS